MKRRPVATRHRCRSLLLCASIVTLAGAFSTARPGSAFASTGASYFLLAGRGGSPAPAASTGTASTSVGLASPTGVVADANGNLVVADTNNNEIDLVVRGPASAYDITGVASPVAGDTYLLAGGGSTTPSTTGAEATSVVLNAPASVAIDPSNNIVVADTYHNEIDVIAESVTNPGYVVSGTWIRGDLYVIAGGGIAGVPTVGGMTATSSTLSVPGGVAFDASGNLVLADSGHNEVELLVMHSTGSGTGRSLGDLYVIAGGGTGGAPSGSGGVATNAQLNSPQGVTTDASGNVLVADTNDNAVDVLAQSPADPGYGIGVRWTAGEIYRIVGGGATTPSTSGVASDQVALNGPRGIATDAYGDVLVADVHNLTLDVFAVNQSNPGFALAPGSTWTTGEVYAVAGGGSSGVTTSGSVADATHLYAPTGVSVLPDGSLAAIDQASELLGRLVLAPSAPVTTIAVGGDHSVRLTWSVPSRTGGDPVSDYVVAIYLHGEALPIETLDLGTTSTSMVVGSLSAGVTYDLTVVAYNAIGASSASTRMTATTDAVAPATQTASPNTLPISSSSPAPPPQVSSTPEPGVVSSHAGVTRARVAVVGGAHRVGGRGVSMVIRCTSGLCQGAISILARHRVTTRTRSGSVTVIEVSVIARGSFWLTTKARKRIRLSITPLGRRLIAARSGRGIGAIATVTTRGGRPVVSHLHIS